MDYMILMIQEAQPEKIILYEVEVEHPKGQGKAPDCHLRSVHALNSRNNMNIRMIPLIVEK